MPGYAVLLDPPPENVRKVHTGRVRHSGFPKYGIDKLGWEPVI